MKDQRNTNPGTKGPLLHSPLVSFFHRFFALFRRGKLEREMDAEMRAHLERETEQNIARGLAPDEAFSAARRSFGGMDRLKEEERDVRSIAWIEGLMRDVRHASRSMGRSPGFAAVTVLTLGLGLTVNLVLFNITNDLFFRPLPASHPEELVIVAQKSPVIDFQIPFSYADAEDFRRLIGSGESNDTAVARVFTDLMAYRGTVVHLSRNGTTPERTWVHAATGNYFAVLGVHPQLGRFFAKEEVRTPGSAPVIVLTDATWRARFAADPTIVGRTLTLSGRPFTVIGVAPQGFWGASWGTALSGFVPATMLPHLLENGEHYALKRGNSSVFLMGRLRPGVTLAEARAAMDVALAAIMQDNPGYYMPDTRAVVMRESDSRPSPYVAHLAPRIVAALSALGLLVLAVAVANAANLLYARAANREPELAIRSAIGASRPQLIRSLLTESAILALAAGALGALASFVLTPALMALMPPPTGTAPAAPLDPDWRPFVVTGVVSLVVGIVAGVLPALKASGGARVPARKGSSPSRHMRRHPMRSLLVIGQVAVSCVVLVAASLALRSMAALMRADLGFRIESVVVASIDLGLQRYSPDRGREFHARLLENVRGLPGVEAASLSTGIPLDTGINQFGGITAAGASPEEVRQARPVSYILAEHTWLQTLGMRIETGRDFAAADVFGAPRVVLVNRALADQLWPGRDPVGQRISIQGNEADVVGVVAPSRYYNIADDARPLVFDALAQNYRGSVSLAVRFSGRFEPLAQAITSVVHGLDPDLPVFGLRTMDQQLLGSAGGLMPYRTGAILAGAQGVIALMLAGAGVFSLISFAVARRTREIGIRMALGASWLEVVRAVTRESRILTGMGLLLGLGLSLALSRVLGSLLYRGGTSDIVILAGVGLLILATALLACWLPARRAARVDPMAALRAE